jgi:hypothetical protein
MFLDLGRLCNQLLCVPPFIISKLPCSSTSDTDCLVCLCLKENFRSAPKLNEAIVLFFPNDPAYFSTICLSSKSSFVHANARFVEFE